MRLIGFRCAEKPTFLRGEVHSEQLCQLLMIWVRLSQAHDVIVDQGPPTRVSFNALPVYPTISESEFERFRMRIRSGFGVLSNTKKQDDHGERATYKAPNPIGKK